MRTAVAWFAPVAGLVTLYQLAADLRPGLGLVPLGRSSLEVIAFIALLVAPIAGYVSLGMRRNVVEQEARDLREQVRLQQHKIERLERELAPLPSAPAGGTFEILSQQKVASSCPGFPHGLEATIRTAKLLSPARLRLEFSGPLRITPDNFFYEMVGEGAGVSGFSIDARDNIVLFKLQMVPFSPERAIRFTVFSENPVRLLDVSEF